jgi:NAD(P)-dependent dehydrogenase (short-subunit alcohol dehydrogenase family)
MSPGSLTGKVCVVTGASRGIGAAIARRFAGAGAAVALLARGEEPLRALADELTATGTTTMWATCDVSVSADVAAAARAVSTALGPIDVLCNNAGAVLRRPTQAIDDADWRRIIGVNLDGTFHVTRAFLPDLILRTGRIINIASIAGREGTALLAAYCAAKHGVIGFTRALAEELRSARVPVNAICPGSVDTAMLRDGLPDAEPDMTPDDIARTALFLAGDAPAALTGSCVDIFG